MHILGIVRDTHDSGVALLANGVPEFVVEEERLNRRKHTHRFPQQALTAVLDEAGLGLKDIGAITTPWHVRRLWGSASAALLKRFPGSLTLLKQAARPTQRDGLMMLTYRLKRSLRAQFPGQALPPIYNVGHHDSHAASFFVSPFEEATILVMDGYGDDASTSVYTGKRHHVERQWHSSIFNSMGILYTFVTQYLGFAGFSDEGKVMALAAFGDDSFVEPFSKVVSLRPNGQYALDMSYFNFDAYGSLQPFRSKFFDAFGPPRTPGEPIMKRHRDIARALQWTLEDIVLHIAQDCLRRFPSRNLVVSGGVGLNCVANARLSRETAFERVWVPPIASDSGAPLGSALWHWHMHERRPRSYELEHAYLGLSYGPERIRSALDATGLNYRQLGRSELIRRCAHDLSRGRIVGWYQGRFEAGPRALGNRSLLADPRRADMKHIINSRIKRREDFRPFAPAVLLDAAPEFFDISGPESFMTVAARVHPHVADKIPAVVHIDGTARVQTVERKHNPAYYDLIEAFGEITGVPVLLNTSFNEREPIVARPEEAIACFRRAEIDVLAIGDFYVDSGETEYAGRQSADATIES
ncbi:MAG: carbamoyltransferase [Hyphomicrobiaceae bacterium]